MDELGVYPDAAREPRRKIIRAEKFFTEARAELGEWSARNPTLGRLVAHPDRRRIDIVLEAKAEPPPDTLALTVGDAVHNLRSALDNLAWNLAHLSGPPPNPKSIQFPVSEKAVGWRKAQKDLETIPTAALDRMEKCQPFTFERKEDSFLWHLHQFDIADKHRGYLVAQPSWVQSTVNGLSLGLDANTIVTPMSTDQLTTKVSGDVLGWLEFSKPFWDLGPIQGTVEIETAFLVMAEEGGPGADFHQMSETFPALVSRMVDFVCGVVPLEVT